LEYSLRQAPRDALEKLLIDRFDRADDADATRDIQDQQSQKEKIQEPGDFGSASEGKGEH